MHVLVDASHNEDFIIVAYRLSPKELLWLLKTALHAFNLANLGVEREAVADPAIISTKDQNLRVVEREAAHSVASRPIVLSIDVDDRLPLLLLKVSVTI